MKMGIVIEVNENHSVVLSEGIYYKIKNKKAMTTGMEMLFTEEDRISLVRKSPSKPLFRVASVAAAVVLVLMTSLVYYNNNLAVFAVVTMDINPSIELSLNKANEVVKADGLNADGESLLATDVLGLQVEEAVDVLVEAADIQGYIDDKEETFIVITTIPMKNLSSDRLETLKKGIAESLSDEEAEEITYAIMEATEKELNQAKAEGKPLPVVKMQNMGKAKNSNSVKEMGKDPSTVIDMAEESQLIRAKLGNSGNSFENRNDLQVILNKLEVVTGSALDIPLAQEAQADYEEATDSYEKGILTAKELKDIGKELLDQLKPYGNDEVEVDEEPYDGGPLKAIISKLAPYGDGDNPQEDIVEFLGRARSAVNEGDKDKDKILREEGRELIKALQKAGIKSSGDDDDKIDGMSGDDEEDDESDKEVSEEKTNNGKSNKADKDKVNEE